MAKVKLMINEKGFAAVKRVEGGNMQIFWSWPFSDSLRCSVKGWTGQFWTPLVYWPIKYYMRTWRRTIEFIDRSLFFLAWAEMAETPEGDWNLRYFCDTPIRLERKMDIIIGIIAVSFIYAGGSCWRKIILSFGRSVGWKVNFRKKNLYRDVH